MAQFGRGLQLNAIKYRWQPYSRQKFLHAKTDSEKGLPLHFALVRRGNPLWLSVNGIGFATGVLNIVVKR